MKVIDKINGSGLFAQSAFSASISTKDNLGRDITATYLTGVNIPESANWNDTSNVVSSNSAQWSQGKTYEGISPIVVNNTQNKISADTWTLSAGDGVSFTEDSANKVTRIDVTAQSGNEGVNAIVKSNSSTWDSVTGKQDSLIFGHGTASGSVSSINGSAIIDDYTYHMLNVTRVSTANLHKTIKSNSGTWNTVTNKLDTTAFSQVSGDFLTTSFSIPESATWNETSNVVQTNSSQWAQSGNYIPYTSTTTGAFPYFETNSGLKIRTLENGILNSTYISPSTIQIRYLYSPTGASQIKWGAVLSNSKLTFDTDSDSAYVDMEKIHTWDSASNYIQTISATYYPKSNPSSFATESWVNGKGFLTAHQDISNKLDSSAFSSVSGDFLTTSFSIPESAVWNETSNVVQTNSAQWAEGGGSGSVSSKYGTISVDGSNIEATNKAIEFKGNGFTSSFVGEMVGNNHPAVFTWDNYSQETSIHVESFNNDNETGKLTYSSNTNVTGEVTVNANNSYIFDVQIPNATAIKFTSDKSLSLQTTRVTAPSSFKVSELAWKEDLPTYEYDRNRRVSAINGNALVGNEDYILEKGFVQNLTSPRGTISVFNNNKIEGTNSAIASDVIGGFVSSYNGFIVQPGMSSTLTWERYVPNTMLLVSGQEHYQYTLTYSANTDVTGTITSPTGGQVSAEIPSGVTSLVIGNEDWAVINYNFTVSAENYYEIGELAWASALPTYEYDSTNKISAINGSALAGGGDIPSGTMNVSGLEYNAVNEISAYNGSAIAQYGAEKQWLQHDDTIVHVANSSQYAFGCNISALQRLMGIDETVLFTSSWNDKLWNVNLSEPISSFKKIRMYVTRGDGANELKTYEYETDLIPSNITLEVDTVLTNDIFKYFTLCKLSGATYTELSARIMGYPNSLDAWSNANSWCHPIKIIGIGRKQ